jgi:uncharacterized protein YecT (DUF1311 family)
MAIFHLLPTLTIRSVTMALLTTALAISVSNAEDMLLRDARIGAMIWRPYQSRIDWTGGKDAEGFASGSGTLIVFDRKGTSVVARITGTFSAGKLSGDVQATYPLSKERDTYRGGYLNWNESGQGTMTFRNGQTVTGIWANGELVQAGAGQVIENEGDVDPVLARQLEVAGKQLQSVYDAFKGKLPKAAAEALTLNQRAWIKYNKTMIDLAGLHLDVDVQRDTQMRLDALMTNQRTAEIATISNWVLSGDKSRLDLRVGVESIKPQMTARMNDLARDQIDTTAMMATLNQIWAIDPLLEIQPASSDEIQRLRSSLFALGIKNFIDAVDVWFVSQSKPSAESVVLKTNPHAPPLNVESVKSVVSRSAALWIIKQPGDTWPQVLPKELEQEIDNLSKTGMAYDPENNVSKAVFELQALGKFLSGWQSNSSGSLTVWAGGNQNIASINPPLGKWVSELKASAIKRVGNAALARTQALDRLKENKVSLAISGLQDAIKEAPQNGDRSAIQILTAYSSLSGTDSVASDPKNWKMLNLPSKEVLDAVTIAASLSLTDLDPALKSAIDPHVDSLAIAPILKDFKSLYQEAGKEHPTPIKAYDDLRATPEWKNLVSDPRGEVKAAARVLMDITKVIDSKSQEFNKLMLTATKLQGEDKFSEAGQAFRAAYNLEERPDIISKAEACEAKTSGF